MSSPSDETTPVMSPVLEGKDQADASKDGSSPPSKSVPTMDESSSDEGSPYKDNLKFKKRQREEVVASTSSEGEKVAASDESDDDDNKCSPDGGLWKRPKRQRKISGYYVKPMINKDNVIQSLDIRSVEVFREVSSSSSDEDGTDSDSYKRKDTPRPSPEASPIGTVKDEGRTHGASDDQGSSSS